MSEAKTDIRALLAAGKPFFFDGAMGTYYASLPDREQVRCEEANLLHAAEVLGIHRAYLQAGAMALKTNTYGLSEDFAYSHTVAGETMLRAACKLAKNAAEEFGAIVFGDIGPAPDGGASSGRRSCFWTRGSRISSSRRSAPTTASRSSPRM